MGQGEERGLESVLGVVQVAEDAAADAQNHRPVSVQEGRECRLVALQDEAAQQRFVFARRTRVADAAQVVAQSAQSAAVHWSHPPACLPST